MWTRLALPCREALRTASWTMRKTQVRCSSGKSSRCSSGKLSTKHSASTSTAIGPEREVVKHGGPQQEGNIAHYAGIAFGHILHQTQLTEGFGGVGCLQRGAQIAESQHDGAQYLSHFVVEFARDSPAFALLCGYQFSGESFQFLAGAQDLIEAELRFVFETQEAPQRDGRQCNAAPDSQNQQHQKLDAER